MTSWLTGVREMPTTEPPAAAAVPVYTLPVAGSYDAVQAAAAVETFQDRVEDESNKTGCQKSANEERL